MKEPDVFTVADNIVSPLGKTTEENFIKLEQGLSGVRLHSGLAWSPVNFYASLFDGGEVLMKDEKHRYTKFEQLLIASLQDALNGSGIDLGKETILIISSTKGNISLLETNLKNPGLKERVALSASAKLVAAYFGFANTPIIVSNACISGVMGIITGMRLLRSGQYENAVIAGADVISSFILSGFQSFMALSDNVCKPFDKSRNGLNLGEGAGTVILSVNPRYKRNIRVKGGSVSNDANHISGPSRTGEELGHAIKIAMRDAGVSPKDIGFIAAHGTATIYNDEMEAAAIALAGLGSVPLNSLKGYYGHTLGAAGLIESIAALQSLKKGLVLPTLGFEESGVSASINVNASSLHLETSNFLKTASGFGGCNAAVVFGK